MQTKPVAIWIQPANGAEPKGGEAGCGGCAGTEPAGTPDEVSAPVFDGDPALVARVLAALRQVHEPEGGHDIIDSGRVHSLKLGDGEATLTLRAGQGMCLSAHVLAEEAFDALRQALPDTDLYLHHDRPLGCAGAAQKTGGAV